MSNRYKIHDQYGINFLTLTVVGWIDIFSRKKYMDMIIDSLKFCREKKGLAIHGYVIMTNHIHLVVSATEKLKLSDIIRDFKAYTAKAIINEVSNSSTESRKEWLLYMFRYFARKNKRSNAFQFWQYDNHPMSLDSIKFIRQKLEYIHINPCRAGWVSMPQHYIYSSASNYLENGRGILEVDILEEFYPFGFL